MLYCKKLDERATLPTVAHPGEDLGYDVYSLDKVYLEHGSVTKVRTGISARFVDDNAHYPTLGGNSNKIEEMYGLLFRDRSSMAAKGVIVSGGVIDAGYTGELVVMLTNTSAATYAVEAGDKIVQMIPIPVRTQAGVKEVENLPASSREGKGFGSSGV